MSSEAHPLTEVVQTDPDLIPAEKEMSIWFSKADDSCRFNTEIASLVKRAINHTDIDVETIKVKSEDDTVDNVEYSDDLDTDDIDGTIVGAMGRFPIGLLKIQSNPRSRNTFAPVISPQKAPDADAFD